MLSSPNMIQMVQSNNGICEVIHTKQTLQVYLAVQNRISQVSEEVTQRAMDGTIEFWEHMAKELSEIKASVSVRIC